MATPLVLPDLGNGDRAMRVSCWLADLGDLIDEGDRIVELLFDGITFDVLADHSGTLTRIECPVDSTVRQGDVLCWIGSPGTGAASDERVH